MATEIPQKDSKIRIVGIGVCGPGEADRYMEKTMNEFARLCDDVLIVTNHATQKEIDLLNKFGFWHYADDREWGRDQNNIKTDLLTRAQKLGPDWVIALDMDEIFAPEFTREKAEELASGTEIGWYFMVVNLYNDTEHFAHDAGIQRFWNIRFYKNLPQYGLTFQRKALHCGLAPPIAYKYGWQAPFYLEHYGLMKAEDRAKKVARYQKYDPQAKYKDRVYYDDLARELKAIPFNRQKLLEKLAASKECQPRKTPQIHG